MKIENFRPQISGTSVVALFDLYMDEESWKPTYTNMKLIRSKKGGLFVAGPASKIDDKYIPFLQFSAEKGKEFQRKVLELLKPFINDNQ